MDEGMQILNEVGSEALSACFEDAEKMPASDEVRQYEAEQRFLEHLPLAVDISELPHEAELRQKTAKFLGKVGVAETSLESKPSMSLKEAAQLARDGDLEARSMVKANVSSDWTERVYKSAHITRTVLTVDQCNQLMQYGQVMEDVALNTLEHVKDPVLQERGLVEAHNGIRQQFYYERGLLKDHAILTRSTVPDDIPREEAQKLGFFTDTMSYTNQLLTEEGDEIVLYTAFVAGADSADTERFDAEAIGGSSAEFGLDYSGLSSKDMLSKPALIHKDLLPDGILTVVEKDDDHAPGKNRFFGRIHEGSRDYKAHMAECKLREALAEAHVEYVTNVLIESADTFEEPTDATALLDTLNDQALKKNIVSDRTIESNVLGSLAQPYIEEARFQEEQGNIEGVQQAQRKIEELGVSSSCPTGNTNTQIEATQSKESTSADLKQSKMKLMSCPHCSAKVYCDPCAKVLACWDCKAMVVNGKVVSNGNGGSKKRRQDLLIKKLHEEKIRKQVEEAFVQKNIASFKEEHSIKNSQHSSPQLHAT